MSPLQTTQCSQDNWLRWTKNPKSIACKTTIFQLLEGTGWKEELTIRLNKTNSILLKEKEACFSIYWFLMRFWHYCTFTHFTLGFLPCPAFSLDFVFIFSPHNEDCRYINWIDSVFIIILSYPFSPAPRLISLFRGAAQKMGKLCTIQGIDKIIGNICLHRDTYYLLYIYCWRMNAYLLMIAVIAVRGLDGYICVALEQLPQLLVCLGPSSVPF